MFALTKLPDAPNPVATASLQALASSDLPSMAKEIVARLALGGLLAGLEDAAGVKLQYAAHVVALGLKSAGDAGKLAGSITAALGKLNLVVGGAEANVMIDVHAIVSGVLANKPAKFAAWPELPSTPTAPGGAKPAGANPSPAGAPTDQPFELAKAYPAVSALGQIIVAILKKTDAASYQQYRDMKYGGGGEPSMEVRAAAYAFAFSAFAKHVEEASKAD